MKKITITILGLFCLNSFAQTKLDITQTNPIPQILRYNLDYISQSQKLLDYHQQFISKISPNSPSRSYLRLEDIRGAKVGIVSTIDMPVLNSNIISFDNQKLQYIANTEKTSQLITQSCNHLKNFLNQEPKKINSALYANLEISINFLLKDGYQIHLNYIC